MKASRRSFFGLMAASPLAAKAAAEDVLAKQAGIEISQRASAGAIYGSVSAPDLTQDQMRRLLARPLTRKFYESALYESERRVGFIDHDIAAPRSISLAAKIVYQRQRNVAAVIHADQHGWIWNRTRDWLRDAVGLLG